MMPHLVHGRLADVDVGELATMFGRDAFVRTTRRAQHGVSPVLAHRAARSAGASVPVSARSAFASPSARGAKDSALSSWWALEVARRFGPLSDADSTGRSSRITSLIGDATLLFKWRINVSSVRTLMRAMAREPSGSADVSLPRSVTERRIERRRPSGNRTTTKAGPRADWAETSSRRCPARP